MEELEINRCRDIPSIRREMAIASLRSYEIGMLAMSADEIVAARRLAGASAAVLAEVTV